MDYILAAFAVFFIINTASGYITMPKWAWTLSQLLLSTGAWALIEPSDIWKPLAISGVVTIIKRAEALLLVTGDRATVELLRSRR